MNKFLVNQSEYDSFWQNALALNGSVTPRVMPNVVLSVLYAVLIACLSHFYPAISLPVGPLEYGGFIMGLILVFRVNAGYDRWWEARKLWGNVVNHSRSLAIIIINYMDNHVDDEGVRLIHKLIALPYLMKNSLRKTISPNDIEHLFDEAMLIKLRHHQFSALYLSSLIAFDLNRAHKKQQLDSFSFLRAEVQREEILNAQGACERILNTPMPFVMAIKSRRFILMFLLMLPFALVNFSLLLTPLVTAIVSYALFSLDQIGLELQNPFSEKNLSHLPLHDICRTIEENARTLMDAKR